MIAAGTDNRNDVITSIVILIGMLLNRVDTAAKGQLTGHLQLIHKQGDVPEYYSQRVYISLPLQELTVDTLYLTIDTYDGVVRKGFLLSKD